MSILELPAESPSTEEDETAQMLQHGITRVSVDYFHFREFRYTNLAEAVAEAQRQAELKGAGHWEGAAPRLP